MRREGGVSDLMSETPQCTSWLGHRFKPRFSYGEAKAPTLSYTGTAAVSPIDVLEATKSQTYEGDICTRCGHFIVAPSAHAALTTGAAHE